MHTTITPGVGRRLANMFRDEADKAVRDIAETVLQRAKNDAPPDPPANEDPDPTVSLRESGHVTKVRNAVYKITFDTPYAAKQHEAMQYNHPRGGGPKYLERNVQVAVRELDSLLVARLRAVTHRSNGTLRDDTRTLR